MTATVDMKTKVTKFETKKLKFDTLKQFFPTLYVRYCWDEIYERFQTCRISKKMFVSKYRPMQHIAPTSNVCERLFSRAKLIMRPHRKMMSPYHLDMLFFLRCYKELWNATTVEECLKDPSGAADVAEATA